MAAASSLAELRKRIASLQDQLQYSMLGAIGEGGRTAAALTMQSAALFPTGMFDVAGMAWAIGRRSPLTRAWA